MSPKVQHYFDILCFLQFFFCFVKYFAKNCHLFFLLISQKIYVLLAF